MSWYLDAFKCHRSALDDMAAKYTKSIEELTSQEPSAKIYCYEEIRTLKQLRADLNGHYTRWAKNLVNLQKCEGLRSIHAFYLWKREHWYEKYTEWMTEYSDYNTLITNKTDIYLKIKGIFEKYEALEDAQWKDPECKTKYGEFKAEWDKIEAKETELDGERSKEEVTRYKVEFLTHKVKHYNKLCSAGSSRFRFKSVATHDNQSMEQMTPWNLAMVQTKTHVTKTKTKTKTTGVKSDKDSNTDNLCGIKCLTTPKKINAEYIKGLINDYIKMQYVFSYNWKNMWRYNDEATKGKMFCTGIMKDIAKTENKINVISGYEQQSESALTKCKENGFEEAIKKFMWDYEYFKIETYMLREKMATFRMRFHSRSRLKYIVDFYSKLVSSIPGSEMDKDKCGDSWGLIQTYIVRFIADYDAWKADSTAKNTEYEAAFTELETNIKASYPCDTAYDCNFRGKNIQGNYFGNKLRDICVSEDNSIKKLDANKKETDELKYEADEACRYEPVKDLKYFSIVMAADSNKYFCFTEKPFDIVDKPEPESPLDENGAIKSDLEDKYYKVQPADDKLTEQFDVDFSKKYDAKAKSEEFKTELNTAEEEVPKYDLSNSDKCTLCGAFTTEKFICKTMGDQKMWLGGTGERIKMGLSYTRNWDSSKKEFMSATDVKCEYSNYIKTSEDKDKYIVKIDEIQDFFLCSTRSSDGIASKFDFDDPSQCEVCMPFNPFKEEAIKGSELENDSAPAKDEEDEEPGNDTATENNENRFKATNGDDTQPEGQDDEEKEEEQVFTMTRQQKIDVIYPTIKDWIKQCKPNLVDKKPEKAEIKYTLGDKTYEAADHYSADDAVERWDQSKCEFYFADGEEFIDASRCKYAKAKDEEGYLLYFRIDHRKSVNGEGSLTEFEYHYGFSYCNGPSGYKDLSKEEYDAEKLRMSQYSDKQISADPNYLATLEFDKNLCENTCNYEMYLRLKAQDWEDEELESGKAKEETPEDS